MKHLALLTGAVVALGSVLSAQSWSITPYGPTCGPVADAEILITTRSQAVDRLWFQVTKVTPDLPVLMILGATDTRVPINFGMPCTLLTELYVTELHHSFDNGTFEWLADLPAGFVGPVCLQMAEIDLSPTDGLTVRTSNAVELAFR